MPKVSIIVPVYNVEKYLTRCIDSILVQTFKDFELILVDDGSLDKCGHICDEYAKKDKRIVVIHQENRGLSGARNTGIDWAIINSSSQWLCFIDSDDWVNKTYLQALYEAVNQEKCLIGACDFLMCDKENNAEQIVPSSIWKMSSSQFYNENFYNAQSACCKIFNKTLFTTNKYRFKEGIIYEDSAIIYQIIFLQKNIAYTDKAKYYYFQRAESITNEEWNPRKMIYFDVQGEQMKWLISHNYEECVATCLKHYLNTLHYNEHRIRNNTKYKKYARVMRRICRKMLRKYGRKYKIHMKEYPRFYETGYPCLMEMYWIITAQLKKIRIIGKLIH